jgi:drug/metabolite transporter (DMT)-like permease
VDPSAEERPSTTLLVLALLALYIIWGSTYLAMRIAMETLPPMLMAGPRFVVAGSVMYGFLRLRGAPSPTRAEWIASAKVGILLLTFGNGAVAIAEQSVSSGVVAVIVASMPIWAALFGYFFGAPPGGREWAGLALGFAGVVILNLGGDLKLESHGLIALVAPISWAFGSVWGKKLPLPKGGMATAAQMITGGIAMLVLAAATGERVEGPPSLRTILAMLYLAAFGSLVAFTAYTWLLRNTRPALATSYAYVNPIVALLLGRFFGEEPLGLSTVAAAAVSLIGVALIAKRTSPNQSSRPT